MKIRSIARVLLIAGTAAASAGLAAGLAASYGAPVAGSLSGGCLLVGLVLITVGVVTKRIAGPARVDVAQERLMTGANDVISGITGRPDDGPDRRSPP